MVASVRNDIVLSFPFFVFFPLKIEEAPCVKATMLIRQPGTLKCPRLPLPASQSIFVSFAATTCQQREGNHHQQSNNGKTVGVPIQPKHGVSNPIFMKITATEKIRNKLRYPSPSETPRHPFQSCLSRDKPCAERRPGVSPINTELWGQK